MSITPTPTSPYWRHAPLGAWSTATALLAALLTCLTGCHHTKPVAQSADAPNHYQLEEITTAPSATQPGADARPDMQVVFVLEIYKLAVPLGTISRNEDFWKRVDEQCVDVATYDLLFKNGIRIGVASADDWKYFFDIISRNPADVQPSSFNGVSRDNIEMTLREHVGTEDIWCFDHSNAGAGRTFDDCDNLMRFAFEPAPRQPGAMLVYVAPFVRSTVTRMEFTPLNNEREVQEVRPERLFEVNLSAVIAPRHFLIISPSEDAGAKTSLGNVFLTRHDQPELTETVLLLVPRSYAIHPGGGATLAGQPAPQP